MNIVRGTTPTIRYKFTIVNVTDIEVAYMTIEQDGKTITEQDLSQAEVGENWLEWQLSQTETLKINENLRVQIQCRYRTSDGNAYASPLSDVMPYEILKEGVI